MARIKAVFLLAILSFSSIAQDRRSGEPDPNVGKVRGIVSYYKYLLNNVGAARTPVSEKEVIINDSFRKVFSDPEVQIEDDLDLDRNAIINKNIQAYLRDVDFFFRDVRFEFSDLEVSRDTTHSGETYYLVRFLSDMSGTSLDGKPVSRTSDRFMEVNYDEKEESLKIASVYTTKVSIEQQFREWWKQLGPKWDDYFREHLKTEDIPIRTEDLLQLGEMDSIDLSGKLWVRDITPLSMLRNLRYVDLSNTDVDDLAPLRYSVGLKSLVISNTLVFDLNLLEYFKELNYLNISQSNIFDLSPLAGLETLRTLVAEEIAGDSFRAIGNISGLEKLDLSATAFDDPQALAGLSRLKSLDISQTNTDVLTGLDSLKLTDLDLSGTRVRDLSPLSGMSTLKNIQLEGTPVSSLRPLEHLANIKRINADFTKVSEDEAAAFMAKKPNTIVIVNADQVLDWWNGLDPEWQGVFLEVFKLPVDPQLEDLMRMMQADSLDLSDRRLLSGGPVAQLKRIKYLNISNNLFTDIRFMSSLSALEHLEAKGLPVDDFGPVASLDKLKTIDIEGSLIPDISVFRNLPVNFINVDSTPVDEQMVRGFLRDRPENVTVLFKSEELRSWWTSLPLAWKEVFQNITETKEPGPTALHQLISRRKLAITGQPVFSLEPLTKFLQLEEVSLSGTNVSDLSVLRDMPTVRKIECMNGPLESLEGLAGMTQLKWLSVANTPVKDLDPVATLKNLEHFNCSGTQVRNIKDLRKLKQLSFLNISNTKAWRLHWLHEVDQMKKLICYNSRVNDRKVAEFREVFPECEVTYY